MRVGVLGGGLQGCCAALALAERGTQVTLFDKNDLLLSRAAVANEGKIHLGYMYAGDPTLSTAKTMMTGALSFAPFFERYLGQPTQSFSVSDPAIRGPPGQSTKFRGNFCLPENHSCAHQRGSGGLQPSLFRKEFARPVATLVSRGKGGRIRSNHCPSCLLHA
jgi:monoamine oxidase